MCVSLGSSLYSFTRLVVSYSVISRCVMCRVVMCCDVMDSLSDVWCAGCAAVTILTDGESLGNEDLCHGVRYVCSVLQVVDRLS